MGRRNVIDGLVTSLQQASGFGTVGATGGTVVAYDHRPLAIGLERVAVVLADSGEQRRILMGSSGACEMTYDLRLEMYIRHTNDVVTARRDADIYHDALVARVNADYTLGGSAFNALVVRAEVEDERLVIGGSPFLLEALTVRATEDLSG